MRERGRKWYKERGKCIIESRIEFSDPMLIPLHTPHGPNTNFLKKNVRKIKGKIIFPPLWFLIIKLDHNSGLHAKNQRETSKSKVRRPPPTLFMEMWTFPFQNCLFYTFVFLTPRRTEFEPGEKMYDKN